MRDHAKDAARLRKLAAYLEARSNGATAFIAKQMHVDAKCARARADAAESTNADLPDSDTLHKCGLVGREKGE